jgi:hypothetical protein
MLIAEHGMNGGVQKVYHFDNGYGASVVSHMGSYGGEDGLWELAVIQWGEEGCEIVYHTPITDDVIGWLTWPMVAELLKQIEALGPDDDGDDARQPDEAQEWYDFDPDC